MIIAQLLLPADKLVYMDGLGSRAGMFERESRLRIAIRAGRAENYDLWFIFYRYHLNGPCQTSFNSL